MPQQLMYVPRQQGFQNQMFNMLSQLMFQKMAFNQRMQVADKQIAAENLRIQEQRDFNQAALQAAQSREDALRKESQEIDRKKEVRSFKKADSSIRAMSCRSSTRCCAASRSRRRR